MLTSDRLGGISLALVLALAAGACGGSATASQAAGASSAPPSSPTAEAPTTASASPSPSATPAASPGASRTPEADQLAAADALEAFGALLEDADLAYRMEQAGSLTTTAGTSEFAYGIDVAGSDFSAIMTIAGETIEVRGIGSTLHVKDADAGWTSAPLDAETLADIVDPWRYLGPLDALAFVSRAPGQMEAFQFANTAPIDYQTSAMRRSGAVGSITTLTFIVLPDGTPVELMFTAEAPDGQGGTLEMTSTVLFSNVGGSIVIESPAPA